MAEEKIYDQREDILASRHGRYTQVDWESHDRDKRHAEIVKAGLLELGISIGTSAALHIIWAIRASDREK